MLLHRYELTCDGENQDVGFLVGIEDIGLTAEKEEELLQPFNDKLTIPDLPSMRNTVSFFTPSGKNKFQQYIDKIIDAYKDSIFDIICVTVDCNKELLEQVVYMDDYQICLKKSTYEQLDKMIQQL